MRHAVYTGPIEELQGETALVRPNQKDELLVQFDNQELTDWSGVKLGFGWHIFPESSFEVDEDETRN